MSDADRAAPNEPGQRHRELWAAFKTYDAQQIAAIATDDEIESAYNAGVIGPNVARKAHELVAAGSLSADRAALTEPGTARVGGAFSSETEHEIVASEGSSLSEARSPETSPGSVSAVPAQAAAARAKEIREQVVRWINDPMPELPGPGYSIPASPDDVFFLLDWLDALLARVAERDEQLAAAWVKAMANYSWAERGQRAEAEAERLREALQWITEFPRTLDSAVRERARAALAGGGEA